MQRFTPRKSRRWSAVNVALVAELEAAGLMREPGRRAFAARDQTQVPYSTVAAPGRAAARVGRAPARRAPGGRGVLGLDTAQLPQACTFWVTEAKRAETREKRFAELVEACARGERLSRYVSPVRRSR